MTSPPIQLQSAQADAIQQAFDRQLAHYKTVGQTTTRTRKQKLKALESWLLNHRQDIRKALHADFAKPGFETDFSETYMALSEARHARKHLRRWMRDEPVRTPLALTGTRSWIRRESKGVCLIMSPWNFPLNLTIGPLASAIAAGNCAILKPSERTPHTTALIQRMIQELFPPEEVTVIAGDIPESQDLLKLPFHHIFFTGSPQVGKLVMTAAAKNLSSVTLELGGKSPCIVDASANLQQAAKRIVWGRFFNAGQTCIAPDYVLAESAIKDRLVQALNEQLQKFYQGDPLNSPDYADQVDERHAKQVAGMSDVGLQRGKHVTPTIVDQADANGPLGQEEIFGPLLPVFTFDDSDQALQFMDERERPLSLYIFSKRRKFVETVLNHTRAGSTGINLTVAPFAQLELPFGGINNSGIGKSHGREGFEAFSNQRAVMKSTLPVNYHFLVAPPYKPWKEKVLHLIMRWF